MIDPIEIYRELPSRCLVPIMKDCKELIAHPKCPQRVKAKARTTLTALRDIMIERQRVE